MPFILTVRSSFAIMCSLPSHLLPVVVQFWCSCAYSRLFCWGPHGCSDRSAAPYGLKNTITSVNLNLSLRLQILTLFLFCWFYFIAICRYCQDLICNNVLISKLEGQQTFFSPSSIALWSKSSCFPGWKGVRMGTLPGLQLCSPICSRGCYAVCAWFYLSGLNFFSSFCYSSSSVDSNLPIRISEPYVTVTLSSVHWLSYFAWCLVDTDHCVTMTSQKTCS